MVLGTKLHVSWQNLSEICQHMHKYRAEKAVYKYWRAFQVETVPIWHIFENLDPNPFNFSMDELRKYPFPMLAYQTNDPGLDGKLREEQPWKEQGIEKQNGTTG